ncbi:hypothetical protein KJA15_00805 [Patescibacteria group bacterium]|nr:hypothetical protein [Patescibacteria group bacterium]
MKKAREKGWNLGIVFRNKAELEDFLEWWGKRVVFGVSHILADKNLNDVIFVGGSGSRLILQGLRKEIKRKYSKATVKIVQANN